MKITETSGRMVVTDTPGCLWLFGLAFIGSGTLVLTVPFLGREWPSFHLWERAAVVVIALSHLAGGLWMVRRHAATRTELDRTSGIGTHRVRRPGSRVPVVTVFSLADVRGVDVRQAQDSEGDPMFQLRLWLAASRVLLLQSQPAHGEAQARKSAAAIRRFLAL